MKKLYASLFTMLLLTSAVFAQIPNNGFETWNTVGTHLNPDGWGTMNNTTALAGLYTATKGTPGSPGTAYLKLTSTLIGGVMVNGIAASGVLDSLTKKAISGFAFTSRPQQFTGKWQHMIYGSSQGSVSATLTRWNTATNQRETIAIANQTLSGMAMSWANFALNFVYQSGYDPDTCIIFLKASGTAPTAQDYLWVDNLAFTGNVVGINESKITKNTLDIFPNPCSDNLNISLTLEKPAHVTMQITDITGKIIKADDYGSLQGMIEKNISTSHFSKGVYFLTTTTDHSSIVKQFIIE